MTMQYDLAIIGSGPGGYVAAIRGAQLGMKVALIEKEKLGGVCLNWGCIPTKALLKSAETVAHIKHAKEFGVKVAGFEIDFPAIIKRSRRVADMNSKGVEYLMKKNGIEVIYATARLQSAGQLSLTLENGEEKTLTAQHIIIATGARPRSLPGIDIDGQQVITSKHAMTLRELPQSLVVIGGGAIGVEFAWFYATLGVKVTIVEMMDSLLPATDKEITAILEKSFKKSGIKVITGARVNGLSRGEQVTLTLEGSETRELTAEKVLMAVGVQGNVEGLNAAELGIEMERGFIKVDEWYRTSLEGVYAIGDIIGPPLLAHVASHEGIICVEKIAGVSVHPLDYRSVPAGTYCSPQVASIGLSEEQARQEGYQVQVGRFPYTASGKGRAIGARDGLVKLIFDEKYGELLGAHIIGEQATELIAELGIARTLEATPVELAGTIHAHPTLAEMIMEAAGDAQGKAIHI